MLRRITNWLATFTMAALLCAADAPGDEPDAGQAAGITAGEFGPYLKVGVVPVVNESGVRGGGESMTELLLAGLRGRFEGIDFILIDPSDLDAEAGPILLEEAVRLGGLYEVPALLTSTLVNVEISGGTWPNSGGSTPQARGQLHWRLVDCSEGLLISDGDMKLERYKAYPRRIRTEPALIRAVLDDLAQGVCEAIEDLDSQQ